MHHTFAQVKIYFIILEIVQVSQNGTKQKQEEWNGFTSFPLDNSIKYKTGAIDPKYADGK